MTYRILMVAMRSYALARSRLGLIERLTAAGHEVSAVTACDATDAELEGAGCRVVPAPFRQGGLAPRQDAAAMLRVARSIRRIRPDVVHAFGVKPLLAAAWSLKGRRRARPRLLATITGLGGRHGVATARLARIGLATAVRRCDRVVFQNHDDRDAFLRERWVTRDRTIVIVGAGIDTTAFRPPEPRSERGPATVLMIARLLEGKGVRAFARTATRVRSRRPDVRFLLAGEHDPARPDAVPLDWIERQEDVTYLGRLADVRPALAQAEVFLFPSTYGEGVPRAVMEAAAMGVPTVAYDVPGVREAVADGGTGRLVAPGDEEGLVGCTEALLGDPGLRARMGGEARRVAVERFDGREVEARYLAEYRRLGVPAAQTEASP